MRHLCLLVCCLAACGDDSVRHTPDAAPHDGPVADMAPDGPPLPVTITATNDGAPQAGVQVYFLDADSSLVLATTTDATGARALSLEWDAYALTLTGYTIVASSTPPPFTLAPGASLAPELIIQ